MTTSPQQSQKIRPMIYPFPEPGELVRLAYRELHVAINGSDDEKKALGNLALLPRPWEPASCGDPGLRHELWEWFEAVVIWINHDYTWDTGPLIPTCWPMHPHLVHEIAVVADQRRRAGLALTSDALEEWHRYCLTAFTDRMRGRLRSHCEDDHKAWPGRARHADHIDTKDVERREDIYALDVDSLPASRRSRERTPSAGMPRLGLVDLDSGEIHDDGYDS